MFFNNPNLEDTRPRGWEILRIGGVPFYVEGSFLVFLLLLLFLFGERSQGGSLPRAGLLCFVVFFSLLIHEGGHALAAHLSGCRGIMVSLVMFGGYARHSPTTHGRSLLISLAGPFCTLLLVVIGLLMVRFVPAVGASDPARFFFGYLFGLNLFWLVLNLLPIYPMDGGQSLFYGLQFFVRREPALHKVAVVSMVSCVLVGLILMKSPFGGLFIYFFLAMFFMQNLNIARALREQR